MVDIIDVLDTRRVKVTSPVCLVGRKHPPCKRDGETYAGVRISHRAQV